MATDFPTSLDSLTNPTGTDNVSDIDHAAQHANANDAIEALEAKVGIDSSAVNTSHDYKLSGVSTGDKASSLTGAETLTNKTLTTPTIGDFTNAGHGHEGASGGGQLDHGAALTGLSDDDHTQYALLAGRSGGQSLVGGTGSGDDLTLTSTSNATKGDVIVANGTGLQLYEGIKFVGAVDENIILIPDNIDGNALEINDDTGGATLMRFKTANGFEEITMYSNTKISGASLSFDSGASVTTILDEDNMVSDSATALATQQSIKAYVDANASGISDVVDDTTPQLGGDLDMNGNQITSPDGTDLIDIPNGSIDFQTASTSRLDITDAGVRMGASGARVTTVLDEDDMSTDSATALSTQQAIKAYVDAQVASAGGTPKVIEVYNFEDIATDYETVASSGGSVNQMNDGPGVTLSKGSTSGSDAKILGRKINTGSLADGYWDSNPIFTFTGRFSSTGGTWHAWGVNASANTGTEPSSAGGAYTVEHMGFIIDVNSSVVGSFDASNSNGTTQTTTDIQASVTETNPNDYACVADSGTNIKFYINGSLVATHTTNLPSGDLGVGRVYFGIDDDGGAGTVDFDVAQGNLQYDIA